MKNRFKDVVNKLQLKSPNKTISEKTGEDKGNVSKYLNDKLYPSVSFLKRFCSAFDLDYNDEFGNNISIKEFIEELKIFPQDSVLYFEGFSFYRLKGRGDKLVQVEFNETADDINFIQDAHRNAPRPTEETQTKDELEELRKRIKEQAQLIELLNEKLETYKKQDVSRTTHARS